MLGCGGPDVTTFTMQADFEEAEAASTHEPVAFAAEPVSIFPDSDVEPALVQGFQLSAAHGLGGRVPVDEDHTIWFAEEFDDDFMLAAMDAIEDLAAQSDGFSIRLSDGSEAPDVVVINSRKPLSKACTGEDPTAQCWAGHTGCNNSTELGDGFKACSRWVVDMNLPNMRAWSELAGRPVAETFAVMFEHEAGHTLGLSHNEGLMASRTYVAEDKSGRPVVDQCHRTVLREFARTEAPGLSVLPVSGWCL